MVEVKKYKFGHISPKMSDAPSYLYDTCHNSSQYKVKSQNSNKKTRRKLTGCVVGILGKLILKGQPGRAYKFRSPMHFISAHFGGHVLKYSHRFPNFLERPPPCQGCSSLKALLPFVVKIGKQRADFT